MTIMGGYYRQYFGSIGLLPSTGCEVAQRTYIWADKDQRTTETAKALAQGLLPNCPVSIRSAGEGSDDPLFDPIAAGEVHPDAKLARAAILGRVGGRLENLVGAHRPAFDLLNDVLNAGTSKQRLSDQPLALTEGKGAIAMTGSLSTASTLTENLLLEYCEGMSGEKLGWGRLDAAKLRQMLELHTAYAELLRRTPYLASARGSNLLSHILRSMEQAQTGKPAKGALGLPGDAIAFISGHDTNVSNLSGMLRLSWLLPGYQADDVPPGGALLFTLWKSKGAGEYSVRLRFIAQSLEQMHDLAPLSLARPPLSADLFIPGCSTAAIGYPCEWELFRRMANRAIGEQ